MKTSPTGGASTRCATRILPALIAVSLFAGCTGDGQQSSIQTLPAQAFVSNLTGRSNTGLWNRRLGLGLRNESDLLIHVDRTVSFDRIQRGDIIVFSQPGTPGLVCHPVVATGRGWIKTKGNFNASGDEWPVTPERYAGRVDRVADASGGAWKSVGNLYSGSPSVLIADTGTTSSAAYANAKPDEDR